MPLITGITAGGQLARSAALSVQLLIVQNVGTVPVAVFLNASGAGDPDLVLAAGNANDDGLGASLSVSDFEGAVWISAPLGGGRVLVN